MPPNTYIIPRNSSVYDVIYDFKYIYVFFKITVTMVTHFVHFLLSTVFQRSICVVKRLLNPLCVASSRHHRVAPTKLAYPSRGEEQGGASPNSPHQDRRATTSILTAQAKDISQLGGTRYIINTPTSRARAQPTLLELPLPWVRAVTLLSKLILREASQVATMIAHCPEMGTTDPRDAHDQTGSRGRGRPAWNSGLRDPTALLDGVPLSAEGMCPPPYLCPLPIVFVLAGESCLLKAPQDLADAPGWVGQHWFQGDPWGGCDESEVR